MAKKKKKGSLFAEDDAGEGYTNRTTTKHFIARKINKDDTNDTMMALIQDCLCLI